jgi:hypothetical protein
MGPYIRFTNFDSFIQFAGGCYIGAGSASTRVFVRTAVLPENFRPSSCADVYYAVPPLPNGVYTLYPTGTAPFQVRGLSPRPRSWGGPNLA